MREERETVVREEPSVVREEPTVVREKPAVVEDRSNPLGPILAVIGIVALLALVIWFFANGPAGSPDVGDDGGVRIENNNTDTGGDEGTAPRGEADTGGGTDPGAGADAGADAGTGAGTDSGAGVGADTGPDTSP